MPGYDPDKWYFFMILDKKLDAGNIIVLDGATGTEVARRGATIDATVWCGVAHQTHPDVVRQIHEDYIRAGADVVTANTFATCRHVLESAGLGDEAPAITKRAVELAHEARDRVAFDRPIAIAGSMSTMLARAPGTYEPIPRYIPDVDRETANYREMADSLVEAGVDLIIMEMMHDLEHAKLAITAAVSTGVPVWIGMSCSRGSVGRMVGWDLSLESSRPIPQSQSRPQIPLETMIDEYKELGGNVFGIMHSTVAATSPGLDVLLDNWSGPVMVYPETIEADPETGGSRSSMTPELFAKHCREWIESGVQIIGGCCGTTVEHIRQFAETFPERVGH